MTLPTPDSNEIGRYASTSSLGTTIQDLLNLGLASVSAAFTKYVRTRTVFRRTTGTLASSTSYQAVTLGTSVIGSAFSTAAGIYTCLQAGEYRVNLSLSFAANATGSRGARLVGSGALGTRTFQIASAGAGVDTTVAVEMLVTLGVGAQVTAQGLQSAGTALTTIGHIVFDRVV